MRPQQRIQISGGLMASLILLFTVVSPMLYLPATMIKIAGQGAWIGMLLGNLGGSLAGLLGIALCLRYPGLMPGQIARQAGGRWFGGLLGLLYGLFFVWVYAETMRDMIDFGRVVLLRETPSLVVGLLIGGTVLYVAWEGLEPVARIGFFVLMPILASFIYMPFTLVKEMSLAQAEPTFYQGFRSILWAGGNAAPWFVECLAVTALVPHLRPGDRPYRWFAAGAGASTLLLAMLMLLLTLVFGPDLPSRFTYPIYSLNQLITLGRTIGRLEMLIAAVWIAAIFIKLSLCVYATANCWSHTFGSPSLARKMLLLASALGLLLTILWGGPLGMIYMSRTGSWILGNVAFAFGWPTLLLLLSLRKRSPTVKEASHG